MYCIEFNDDYVYVQSHEDVINYINNNLELSDLKKTDYLRIHSLDEPLDLYNPFENIDE